MRSASPEPPASKMQTSTFVAWAEKTFLHFSRSDRLLRTSRVPTYLLPRILIEKAITMILKTNAPNV